MPQRVIEPSKPGQNLPFSEEQHFVVRPDDKGRLDGCEGFAVSAGEEFRVRARQADGRIVGRRDGTPTKVS